MTLFKQLLITLTFLSITGKIFCYQPYHASTLFDNQKSTISAPNLVDLTRELKTSALEEIYPAYTPTSAIAIGVNLRGLKALTSFAANSTTLVLEIPNAGITETFTGSTRDESLILFKDFIKEGRSLRKLLKAYCKYSPIDPVAGNPTSLMAGMAEADYLLATLSPFNGCGCCFNTQPLRHQFQAGLDLSRATVKKYDSTGVLLPLRYSYSPCNTWALIIDAPIEYIRNGGASSIAGSLGLGFRYLVTPFWSLTPIVRMGSGGSLDLCTSGNFISAGAVSSLHYKIQNFALSMTNYAGYVASTNLWLTGVNFNYHLHNMVYKNGISIFSCEGFSLGGRQFQFGGEIKDSYFAGDKLFIRHYDEFVIKIATTCINKCLDYDCLTTDIAYQWGEKGYKGYRLNFTYQF